MGLFPIRMYSKLRQQIQKKNQTKQPKNKMKQKTNYLPVDSLLDWTTQNLKGAKEILISDIDLCIRSRPKGLGQTCIMLLEIKRKNAEIKPHQKVTFSILHSALNALNGKEARLYGSRTTTINYYGFHLLQFSNTSPTDGKIFLNRKEINETELINFLNFNANVCCFN